jgi:hypothetical protein
MRRSGWIGVAAILLATVVAGLAYAGTAPGPTDGGTPAPSTATPGDLPLVLSIRALSVGPAPLTETGDGERVRASTGAGTTRWPSASTQVGRGVYISVMPACIPGVDEPAWPGTSRRRR